MNAALCGSVFCAAGLSVIFVHFQFRKCIDKFRVLSCNFTFLKRIEQFFHSIGLKCRSRLSPLSSLKTYCVYIDIEVLTIVSVCMARKFLLGISNKVLSSLSVAWCN